MTSRLLSREALARDCRAFYALLLGFAALLVGCTAPGLRVTGIPIAKDASFDLLPPSALKQSVSLEQIVDARYGDKTYTFHCLLEVDEKHLVLVGMTPFNTRAFTLTLKDQELDIDIAPGAQLPADPSRILADLQLALWPAPQVRGLELTTTPGPLHGLRTIMGAGHIGREFKRDGDVVIRVVFDASVRSIAEAPWCHELWLHHLEQDYTLNVRTVRAERLTP